MAWEQIVGFFTMWLHPEITIALWSRAHTPLWQTLLYTSLWTSFTLVLTYLGAGWVKKRLGRVEVARKIIKVVEEWQRKRENKENNGKYQKKIVSLLSRQKEWLVLACGFIPFVYGLPAAVIVTAKLMEIRRALPILMLGNIFRNAIICLSIYQGFAFFS